MLSFISISLLLLGCILSSVLADLGIAYDDVTSCSSSVVEMNSLSFDCNQATGCTLGDEVTVTGQCKCSAEILDFHELTFESIVSEEQS